MNRSTPGLPVHHQLLEFTQTHVHRVGDAIQPSHPLSSPSPPALNISQHQGFFQRVSSPHQAAKDLEFGRSHAKISLTICTALEKVTNGCESWTIKKAGCQRIDAFEPWCWRKLLRVPWTARRSNQPIIKEISPKYSLKGLMLKL